MCVEGPPPPPPPPEPPPPDPLGGASCDAAVGNPCDPATGNKYQAEADYPGGEGIPSFTRHYNSQLNKDLGFGVGWSAPVTKRLEINGTVLLARHGDARGEPFTCASNGPCVGNADTKLRLTKDPAGYTLAHVDGATERYDTVGALLAETDRAQRTTSYSYNSSGLLTAVAGPNGHTLNFTYSGARVAAMTDPSGAAYTYSYDAQGNLIRVDYPDGTAKLYHYENASFPNHLTGISHEEAGGSLTRYSTYAYGSDGRAILTEHAGGVERFNLQYDSDTQTTVTDAAGTAEVLTFAPNLGIKNLVSKINQGDGKGRIQTFDTNNNLTCKKDEEGRVTTYTYNSTNQKTSTMEGLVGSCSAPQITSATRTTTFQYVSATLDAPTLIQSPSVAASASKSVALTYADTRFPTLPTAITQSGFTPAGTAIARAIALSYNPDGKIALIDGPRSDADDVTRLAYHECSTGGACGQLRSVTNALDQVTAFDAYDGAARLTQMTDPNGVRTNYTYDARGRVVEMTQTPPDGSAPRVTRYSYNAADSLTSVRFPDGITLTYTYDAAHKLRSVTDNLGNRITYDYDLRGNRTAERTLDPEGTLIRAIESAYDLRNNLASVNNGGAITEQLNDALSNLTKVTDPNQVAAGSGVSTNHTYDPLNRLIETVDNLSGVTRYTYDVADRLSRVQAPNSVTTRYVYDDLGNLLEERSPDRGVMRYTYDAAGNVKTVLDARGITVAYTYDALNRVTFVDYPGTQEDIAFTYDTAPAGSGTTCSFGIGRLCRVRDESGITDYAYDPFGNVVQQQKTELGLTYETAYTYDTGDRGLSITYPDGRLVTYDRDAIGRIVNVTAGVNGTSQPIVSARTYRADGLLLSQTYGNGLNEIREYNLRSELTRQFLGTADTRLYAYDPNGNLTRKQSLPEAATYRYDRLDRLSETARDITNDVYTYDPNGNRLSDSDQAYSYTTGTNRLEQAGASPVTLDPAGNTLADGTGREYRYNQAGRLFEVYVDGTRVATYTYNHRGQRTRKVTAQGTTLYHYDLQGNLLNETAASGKLLRAYVWAENEPLGQIDTVLRSGRPLPSKLPHERLPNEATTEALTFLHADHLATPRLATNANATKVWSWEGEAFGHSTPNEDPDNDRVATTINLRYPGQYFDQETGLHYNWNRYYDSGAGRYITSDPIGVWGGLNTYTYVQNNPLRFIDPTGRETTLVCRPVAAFGAMGFGKPVHCAVIVWHWEERCGKRVKVIDAQFSVPGFERSPTTDTSNPTYLDDRNAFNNPGGNNSLYDIPPPLGMSQPNFDRGVISVGSSFGQGPYWPLPGPNSNTAAFDIIRAAGGVPPNVPGALGQGYINTLPEIPATVP